MSTTKHLLIGILFSFLAGITFKVNAQYEIPSKPKDSEQHFVYDYTNLLSKSDSINLNIKLRKYARYYLNSNCYSYNKFY